MRIIDASVAVKWIVDEQGSAPAREILKEALTVPKTDLIIAPAVLLIEVFYVVAKKFRANQAQLRQLQDAQSELPNWFDHVEPLNVEASGRAAMVSMALRNRDGAVVPFGITIASTSI